MYKKLANRTLAALGVSLGLICASAVTLDQMATRIGEAQGSAEPINVIHATVTVSHLNKVRTEESTMNLWAALLYLGRYHGSDAFTYVKKDPSDRAADALNNFQSAVKALDFNKVLPPPSPDCNDTVKCWDLELTQHPDSGLTKEQVHAGVLALEQAHIYDLADKAQVQLTVQSLVAPNIASVRILQWLEKPLLVITSLAGLMFSGYSACFVRRRLQERKSSTPS